MNQLSKSKLAIAFAFALSLAGCSDNEPGGSKANDGYGELGGNLITIGSTRNVTYTSCVLLGTVDFPKITGDHSYGIVYMEALKDEGFDYDTRLQYGGHSGKNDKEDYDCIDIAISNSTADGKFEKQIVGLKPATKYYYRAFVSIGRNVNYSNVESFTTTDPTPEITMATNDPTDIYAVSGKMNGFVNIGKLQDVNEDQEYGFVIATAPQLSEADKLTYEYYEEWLKNHFETEDEFPAPFERTTTVNLNGRISVDMSDLRPGMSYYYRTFFKWNDKYFYSPEVKTLKTNGSDVITVGTNKATDVTHESAVLNASVPFSQIGLETVSCGFMISKVYTDASEFIIDNAAPWHNRNAYPEAEVFYVSTSTSEKDFSATIDGLDSETTYSVRAFIYLSDEYLYGSMQTFRTEEYVEPDYKEGIEVSTSGNYPWTDNGDGTWTSGNRGESNSISTLSVTVTHRAGQTFYYDYVVSSEEGYDGLIVSSGSLISGEVRNSGSMYFAGEGTTIVTFQYRKDGSASNGNDCAIVGNFRLM